MCIRDSSYRGLETPYEYLWLLADDVLIWHKADVDVYKRQVVAHALRMSLLI